MHHRYPKKTTPQNTIPHYSTMKIAITGAHGGIGRTVVALCAKEGHPTIQIDLPSSNPPSSTPSNSEQRTADIANDYDATVEALRGCDAVIHLAAIPRPGGGNPDSLVHENNVQTAFNAFRACGELGIKRICYVSSVNAIGMVYSNQPLKFKYFPIDEDYPPNPTDAYALAKAEAELQARAFVNWYPGTKIACLRLQWVLPKEEVKKARGSEEAATKDLWGYVHPDAAARACLLAVVNADNFEGCEVFNIVAPDTTEETPSRELAGKYYPDVEMREGLEGNRGFWTVGKAERLLGWEHVE
jgi:nucleoside-diphosphate-sugar epimerase